jgi:hypothetical protein
MSRATASSFVVAAVLVVLAAAGDARANGRYPAANDVVIGPGAANHQLIVRTTFGLLTSEDRGRSWRWICEDALGPAGTWDAAVVLAADGDLLLGVPSGILRTTGRCEVTSPAGAPACLVPDLATDPAAERVVAAIGCTSAANGVATSDDRGKTFATGATMSGFFVETVEIAASDPKRIYMSGYTGGVARLLRSDDGGATFSEVTRDFFGGNSAFVSAVDAKNADVLFVRSDMGVGTMLLKSIDGGAHFTKLGETSAKMIGFALSDDGRTVWMGSADRAEGIQRSIDGGPFTRVAADVTVRCMRFHAGALYVCGDELTDGFALACSHDGGDHLRPIFSLRNVIGPEECPAGSLVNDVCAPLWPTQREALQPPDAGPAMTTSPCDDDVDAGPDAATDVPFADAAPIADTSSRPADSDAAIPPRTDGEADGGCGCVVTGARDVGEGGVAFGVALALATLSLRRLTASLRLR